jgi:hypothetical protein
MPLMVIVAGAPGGKIAGSNVMISPGVAAEFARLMAPRMEQSLAAAVQALVVEVPEVMSTT